MLMQEFIIFQNKMGKYTLYELEELMEPGAFLRLSDGSLRLVMDYDKKARIVTFENGEKAELYALSNSIQEAELVRDSISSASNYGKNVLILSAVLNITFNCKYHIYPKVILAYLKGDKDHYIYKWCGGCDTFGLCQNIDLKYIKNSLDFFVATRTLKAVKNKLNQVYYLIRKDRKSYPKPRTKNT